MSDGFDILAVCVMLYTCGRGRKDLLDISAWVSYLVWIGLFSPRGGEESELVKGVRLLAGCPRARLGAWCAVLNTEEAVLLELAEPTPLSKSP